MPQPTQSSVHIDVALTNVSVAYMQEAKEFISTQIFPVIPSEKQSDKYFIYKKDDWFRDEAQLRADATESAGSGYNISNTPFQCDVWALHKDVGDQVSKNTDVPLNPEVDAALFLTQRMLIRQEKQWANDFFQPSVWGTTVTGGTNFTAWSNYTTSDPIKDIKAGRKAILSITGKRPNRLVCGYNVFEQLKDHPDVVDRYKYTTNSVVTEEMLAKLFDVEQVLVADTIYASNNEGGTDVYNFIHSDSALLCYTPPAAGVRVAAAGYTFMWTGVSQGYGQTVGLTSFRMEHLKATRVEAEMAWSNQIIGADLGYFFSSAI